MYNIDVFNSSMALNDILPSLQAKARLERPGNVD